MKLPMPPSLGLAALAGMFFVSRAFAIVSVDYVTVGNAGNANDAATGSLYGAVAYAYKIAKNETTISQYAEFLNAVAKTDTYGLYSMDMTTSYINGISRSGASGSFTYSVNPGSGNKPITCVSWYDAARFTNWLHNGQQTGAGAALTAETGAYTLNGATVGNSVTGAIIKNVGATVWIPSESEWYKAAYYDPNKGGTGVGGYWPHATQNNTITTNDIGMAGAANFYDLNDGYAVYTGTGEGTWATTDVGAYGSNSDSYYGTQDQAGNVWEWNDAVIGLQRGLRGGAWDNLPGSGESSSRYNTGSGASIDSRYIGFRVAGVPEPTSLVLTILAGGGILIRRKR